MTDTTPAPKTQGLIMLGGVLLVAGVIVLAVAASAASKAELTGSYNVALGIADPTTDSAAAEHVWMWIGGGAGVLGVLVLIGVAFLHAARR